MFAGLFSILVISTATEHPVQQTRLIMTLMLRFFFTLPVVPENVVPALPGVVSNPIRFDTNLTFFSEVFGCSDDEIQQEVQNALEFSLTEPNELGLRFFQNATPEPIRLVTQINAI